MTTLRWTAVVALGFLAVGVAAAASGGDAQRAEADIRQVIDHWDQGWRAFDAELTTRDYATDADWTNAFGDSRKGRPAIQDFLVNLYGNPGIRSRKSTPSKTTLRFLRADIAAASSYRETVGQKTASGAEYPTRKTHDLRVLVRDRESGRWSIVSHLIMDEKETRP